MSINDKYQKAGLDYYVSLAMRKISNSLLAYPEFMYLFKIIIGFIVVGILFLILKKTFGI
jgi:hypothetical protein